MKYIKHILAALAFVGIPAAANAQYLADSEGFIKTNKLITPYLNQNYLRCY